MGLDVSAYSKLKKLDVLFNEDGEPVNPETREVLDYDDYFKVYANPHFPRQAADLTHKGVYAFEDSAHVWSGGYGRYNNWREELAKLAGYTPALYYRIPDYAPSAMLSHSVGAGEVDSGPFHELIHFTDCDGVIGPTICAKLARDFAEWDERAKALGDGFYESYRQWREGFELAADGGAVHFH
jgi:hypothetical protein